MGIIRNHQDLFATEELTNAIINIPNMSGMLKSLNVFDKNYTDQLSVTFDKVDEYTTLLHDVNRNGGSPTRDGNYAATMHAFKMAYFHDLGTITEADFRAKRKIGTANEKETLQNIIANKLVRMKGKVDLTHEYMILKAANGVCSTPDGLVLADMFTEFGVTRPAVDFDLGSAIDVGEKIREVIDTTQAGLETGGMFQGDLLCFVHPTFFNKLVTHASVTAAYYNSLSNSAYRESMSTFKSFGAINTFTHQGIEFVSYNYSFPLKAADGTTSLVQAIPDNEGFILPRTMGQSIFEAWYGPSRKIGSQGGEEIFVSSYEDPKGYYVDLDVESSPLFYCTKPKTLVRVHTST